MYHRLLAAAYVRGWLMQNGGTADESLMKTPLDRLTDVQTDELMRIGREKELKLYRFKQKDDLPRVRMALGFLRAVRPETLLDIGSGRGVFLFPFLRDFPDTPVTSADILPYRAEFLRLLTDGGIDRLTALEENICTWDAPDDSFDVVTALEVFEHIPEVEKAVANALRLARRYVVVSVPSKPDNNPEHIHLLTKERLTEMFSRAGAKKLHFDGVNGHLFMTASKR